MLTIGRYVDGHLCRSHLYPDTDLHRFYRIDGLLPYEPLPYEPLTYGLLIYESLTYGLLIQGLQIQILLHRLP